MALDLLQKFPTGYTPNSSQVKLLTEIEAAFNEGYKFVVCSAPTGSGKSFVSKTLGNAARSCSDSFRELVNSYQIYKRNNTGGYQNEDEAQEEKSFGVFALTITKALQDQYKDLFDDISVMKGKSNYQCSYDERFSVECAPCVYLPRLKDQCCQDNSCPYYNARNQAITSTFTTLNYNMFFSLPSHVKSRQYMVCDEAAELEDQLVKEFSCPINFDFLKRVEVEVRAFPGSDDYNQVGRWINNLCLSIDERVDEFKEAVNAAVKKKKTLVKINDMKLKLSTLMNLHNKIKTLIDTWSDSEYIIERVDKGINFTPLKVDKLSKYIFNYADKVVLMSATIIDPQGFCTALGIDKFKYIEAESTFDPKKAPIYSCTKVKLNYNNLQANLPKILKSIEEICEIHKDEKGLIHSQTHAITQYLQKNLKGGRFLFREPGVRNEEILETHYDSEDPTVLVSPSMSHGVDLKDDLARFQIIIKAPYLPMNDKRVEKMMKGDFHWYRNKMLSAFIQACGRGVRSTKDHCNTYVLDASIIEAVISSKSKIPKYFIDRFV